jgi:hypothetical protein
VSRPLPALIGAGLLSVALPLGASVVTATPAAAAPGDTVLTVVHGVRGFVADVRLDDKLVLSGFAPERVTDPLEVPPGEHRVQAWPTGAAPGTAPVLDQVINLVGGEHVTAGIGLDQDGKPTITLFKDDGLLADSGSTALVVRGLADADPVKVVAGDRTISDALGGAQQGVQQIAPGTYPVSVQPANGGPSTVPTADIPVVAGRAVVLYLIGSQQDNTLGWVAQSVLPNASSAPLRIDTGFGEVPTAGDATTTVLVLGLPTALLAAVALRRRHRPLPA